MTNEEIIARITQDATINQIKATILNEDKKLFDYLQTTIGEGKHIDMCFWNNETEQLGLGISSDYPPSQEVKDAIQLYIDILSAQ
jgi:hypothetical protein